MIRFLKPVFSLKTTALLLVALSALMLLNVVLPQEVVLGEAGVRAMAGESRLARFALLTLGLGHIPTSPIFLVTLGLFFANLLSVIWDRAGATIRRIKSPPPGTDVLARWTSGSQTLAARLPVPWEAARAQSLLRGFGYRSARVGERCVWGVRHRSAALGFLLFHGSFFVLCAGGASIYYTRFAGKARLVEGQTFAGDYQRVLRAPPIGGAPTLRFTVLEVAPTFERGEPTDLRASLRFEVPGGARDLVSSVNHPARWGSASVLVEEAGVAPEIWLLSKDGYTLDHVSVAATTREGEPTVVPMAAGRFRVTIQPLWPGAGFPDRRALGELPVSLSLREGEGILWEGRLRPGEYARAGEAVLRLTGNRYWVNVRIVAERGGALLIAGFCLAVAGITWRMVMFRREIVVTWDDDTLKVTGQAEFFHGGFGREVECILEALAGSAAPGGAGEAPHAENGR